MSDVIEQAYQRNKKGLADWGRLYRWLDDHRGSDEVQDGGDAMRKP